MNKVLELLEQYCQWLAIAIGGVFLGWVLWTYILFSPVSQKMPDGTSVDPGTVDAYVKKMESDPLERDLTDDQSNNSAPTARKDVTEPWKLALAGGQSPTVPPQWSNSIPQDVVIRKEQGIQQNNILVTSLPTLPSATINDQKSARAFIGAVPVAGQPVPSPQPGPNGVVQAAGKDLSYVRVVYTIDPKAIEKTFAAANIPPAAYNTSIVEIKLMRQELTASGDWTNPVEIQPLTMNAGTVVPVPQADWQEWQVNNFNNWIISDQGMNDLIRPAFYPVLSGEGPWDAAVDEASSIAVDAEAERKAQLEANRKAAEERAKQKQTNRPSTPTTPPGMGPGGMDSPEGPGGGSARPGRSSGRSGRRGVVNDPSRPQSTSDLAGLQLAQATPPGYPGGSPGYPGGYPGRPGMPPLPPGAMPPGMNPGEMPGQPQPQQQNQTPPLPAGNAFNPANQALIVGWAYDETVVEGHTYRYQIIYAIRNPVFGANNNIVAQAALAAQFAIESKLADGAWSQPVSVKSTTEFYLASSNWTQSSVPSKVKIEVFKWANGKWQKQMIDVSPGDRIGSADSGADFATSDALIDIRFDKRLGRPYVLVMGSDGTLRERDPASDRSNPRHKQLLNIINPPANPGGNPNDPANAGMPLPPNAG